MQAQEDMRFQENIDSYSMSEKQGRASPDVKRMMDDHEHGKIDGNFENSKSDIKNFSSISDGPIQAAIELGKSHQWQIDTVIDWKRVVETFRMYQGGGLEETENKENESREAKDNIAEDLK